MENVQVLNTSIVEISQTTIDSTSKEITMLVHKLNSVNANGLDFLKEYTEVAMKSLVDKPVVCKYHENIDDLGGHEHVVDPKTGKIIELNTIAIGTITDVWIDKINEDDETEALFAKATLWSYKYPKIMEVIERNFADGICTSSVEVEVNKYNEGATQEYRYPLVYNYLANTLLGQSTSPADSDAGVMSVSDKEIAEAIKQDLEINQEEKEEELVTEVFNKGYEINYHGQLETSSLKFSEVSNQIYNLLNPINAKSGYRQYNYYIRDLYVDFIIAEDEDDYTTLWKIPYKIENDIVILSSNDEWVKGKLGFIPDGINIDEIQLELSELNNTITKLKEEAELQMSKTVEELQAELATKETEIAEFKTKLEEVETKVAELNETIVSQETAKKGLEEQITELNAKVEELAPFKEQIEKAEKEAKVAEISSRYEKLLSEETYKSVEVQEALQSLDSAKLNEIVVNEVAKQKVVETELSSSKTDDVVVTASKQEDLLPQQDVVSKYGLTI